MPLEPTTVVGFRSVGADEEYPLFSQTAHGEVADQLAAFVQHWRERDPADARHAIRHDPRKPLLGARSRDLELPVVRDLEESDVALHGLTLAADVTMSVRTVERHLLAGLGRRGREPQRMFEATVIAEDSVCGFETLVYRRSAQRASRRQLFVRETDAKPPRVVLAYLGVGVGECRPVTVASDIHSPDVRARIALDHPLREREPDATSLAEARHHAAGDPEVAQSADRSYQRIAVGRERERPVHHLADADLTERGKVLEADLETRGDPLEVVRQQALREVPRRLERRPRYTGPLIGAEQHPAALLTGVDLAFEVDNVQLLLLSFELREVFGDEVLVLHRQHGQLQPHHTTDFAGPEPACVHDVLGVHVARFRDHVPGAIAARFEVDDARLTHDLGAPDLRGLGVRLRHAVRIDVSLDGIEQRADEVALVHEGEEPCRLIDRDDLEVHAEIAAACLRHPQPVETVAGAREHETTRDVHSARLAGDLLELLVEVDGVLLQLGDVRVAVDRVHAAGGVPGRAAGELAALDQQHVLPAGLGQVIEHAGADHTAADHDHPCVASHIASWVRRPRRAPPCESSTRWKPPALPPGASRLRCARSARSARSGTDRWPCPRAPPALS